MSETIIESKNDNKVILIDRIIENVQVRKIKEKGVELLESKIKKIGFLESFPILVTRIKGNGFFRIIDGNHRLEAAKKLNFTSIPAIIQDSIENEEKLARQCNEASETSIPTTFIDDAEFIWRKAEEGKTQEAIADILGWSVDKVHNYKKLDKICKEAWKNITTTFENIVGNGNESLVGEKTTFVGSEFTEGLLRSILSLRPKQQIELVKDLIAGNIQKSRFKNLAVAYRARNEMKRYSLKRLSLCKYSFWKKAFIEIDRGSYDKEWLEGKGQSEKLEKLIKSIIDEWNKKNSIQLINGDFYEEIENIPDSSVDLIITDPPYNISQNKREIVYEKRSNISMDFGEWDKIAKYTFIELLDIWSMEFKRILKENGSGYIFTSDNYISYLREALERSGLKVKATIIWHKTNPGTQPVQTNFKSSIEYILFFTNCESGHIFNWLGENEMQNFIETSICQGEERIKDNKGNTLHPTQKPEKVIKHFMQISSNRGDQVFDGFMGVGTSGKVAKDLGRKFIGIEQDENYFKASQERMR